MLSQVGNTLELKLAYNKLLIRTKDKTPAYYAKTKTGTTRTYNKSLIILSYNFKGSIEGLKETCPRAHVHTLDYKPILTDIKRKIAYRLGLKVYKNGNFPTKTENEISEYLSF